MNGLEIFFITSLLSLLILWIWFIVQGFQASRLWGVGIIFLFPISPFMFAYRFERKSRQAIYYFTGCLFVFIALIAYIPFATIDFYPTLLGKLSKSVPRMSFPTDSEPEKKLNLPAPTYIPPPLEAEPETKQVSSTPVIKRAKPSDSQKHYKQTIDMGSIGNYIGKNVIITMTTTVVHEGKLNSVDNGEISIKKTQRGGSVIMPLKKSKISKIEVSI